MLKTSKNSHSNWRVPKIRKNPPREIRWQRYPSEWHVPILTPKTRSKLREQWRKEGWIPTRTKAEPGGVSGVLTLQDVRTIVAGRHKRKPQEGKDYIKIEFSVPAVGDSYGSFVSRYINPRRRVELAKKWALWKAYHAEGGHQIRTPSGIAVNGEIIIFGEKFLVGADGNFYDPQEQMAGQRNKNEDKQILPVLKDIRGENKI